MHANRNPYSAPSTVGAVVKLDSRSRFVGRAAIALLLAAATAFTAVLTGGLWSIGAIDLGRYGFVFLCSLLLASAILVFVAKNYTKGSRRMAIGLSILVLCIIFSTTLFMIYDAGELF